MMLQTIISILFYITFVLYVFQGVYCLTLNEKARLNQVFFLGCMSFSIWAFAFAISNSLNSADYVLLWRRIASFGWGTAFSFILHFTLILTEENKNLRTKGIYAAIYLPAVISVFVFGLYGEIANEQYNLIHTPAGWGNIPINNFWDIFYNVYYLSFSIITLLLLLKWYQKSIDTNHKKHALLLFLAFAAAIVIGTLSEMLVNAELSFKIPSIAPIVMLIPVMIFTFTITNLRLTVTEDSTTVQNNDEILSSETHTTFIRYIAIVYFIISITTLFLCFFYPTELYSDMLFSTEYVLLGVICFILPFTGLSMTGQDRILTVIMAITIPFTMVRFSESMSNILWTIPLIYLLMTIVFKRKKMFAVISGITVITWVYMWIWLPEQLVHVGMLDYLARLIIYAIAIFLAAYINHAYIVRLKQNDQQVGFQKIIASITTNFVSVTEANFDDKVMDLLKECGDLINADRAYLALFSEDQGDFRYTHEWLAGDGGMDQSIMGKAENHQTQAMSWGLKQLLDNIIVYIPSADKLIFETATEKENFLKQNIQSLIYIPIRTKKKIIGYIGFDQISAKRAWHINDHELLRVPANILADAITKVETEKEMNYLAYYDSLTELPNRVLFNNRLKQAIELGKRSEKFLGVMFIDIDGFKEVNDTMGHNWGDHLLNKIGMRLAGCVRKYDTVARFGGDEFLLMIPQITHRQDLEEIAQKIMGVFHEPVSLGGQEFYITASGGVAVFPEDGENVNTLIKNADLAMYAAKKNGKGQVVFCSGEMKNEVLLKMILTNSLYQALERNELVLNYQPQVCVSSQEIIGFEALLRWEHPELGSISPVVFIPIAEDTGLINSIGEWVLLTACAQNKAWQEMGFKPVQMAVNLSVEQFRSGQLESVVKACLEKTGLEPQYLELEITESVAMKESQHVLKCLHALKDFGVVISIDDFGTEFSSLSRLKDLPVDRLKIDMQFIQGIAVNAKDESIIAVMINLASRLGLKIIAEGVETKAQHEFLKDENCDEIQGYYYYKPLSKEAIESGIYRV